MHTPSSNVYIYNIMTIYIYIYSMRDFCSSLKCGNVKKSFPHFHKAQEPYLEGARVCVYLEEKGVCRRNKLKHITHYVLQVVSLRHVSDSMWEVKYCALDAGECFRYDSRECTRSTSYINQGAQPLKDWLAVFDNQGCHFRIAFHCLVEPLG